MTYTIKEASDITGIPATTLRYYDKEGILPFLERKESGHRMFSEQDLSMLRIIECLKCTGMSIKDIRQYAVWAQMGDSTLEQRYTATTTWLSPSCSYQLWLSASYLCT